MAVPWAAGTVTASSTSRSLSRSVSLASTATLALAPSATVRVSSVGSGLRLAPTVTTTAAGPEVRSPSDTVKVNT